MDCSRETPLKLEVFLKSTLALALALAAILVAAPTSVQAQSCDAELSIIGATSWQVYKQ